MAEYWMLYCTTSKALGTRFHQTRMAAEEHYLGGQQVQREPYLKQSDATLERTLICKTHLEKRRKKKKKQGLVLPKNLWACISHRVHISTGDSNPGIPSH